MSASLSTFSGRKVPSASRNAFAPKRRVMPRQTGAVKVQAKKVAVLGAGGGIGQPLALLLKMNKLVTELALYDIAGTEGVAADLSHCNTPITVTAHTGPDELATCLKGCDLVIIPAGIPRKPGMSRDDLFSINAGIVAALVEGVAQHCPGALLNIITNPVNSTVPIAAEILKAAGVFDPAKLMGVTTLDVVRSNTFVSELKELDMKFADVPVIGGHSGVTILPLLSKVTPNVTFTAAEAEALTERIQNAGTEVVEAKAGKGSATLSMAYAAGRMAESCLLGLEGEDKVYECTFVQTDVVEGCKYVATKCRLGPNGVAEVLALPDLSPFETEKLAIVKEELNKNVAKGEEFAASFNKKATV